MISTHQEIINRTLCWIKTFIIEYTICPFSSHVIKHESLAMSLSTESSKKSCYAELIHVIETLENNSSIETALILFPTYFSDFYDYLDFANRAEQILIKRGYEGMYQLATFHPEYCFADANPDDVTNYTNRSPYPMLHILRETSIDTAIEFYGNTEQIPLNNINKLRDMGFAQVQEIVERCLAD